MTTSAGLWTMQAVAEVLEMKHQTIRSMRKDRVLPPADEILLGRPLWRPATIVFWAAETGRLSPTGQVIRLKPPGRPAAPGSTRSMTLGGHRMTIEPSPKMDTPGLVAAVCSCGEYRSGAGSKDTVFKAWRSHAEAKTSAAATP